jgi:hypothetical protein
MITRRVYDLPSPNLISWVHVLALPMWLKFSIGYLTNNQVL